MDATMAGKRSLIDAALDALTARQEKKAERIRRGGNLFPAADCEFPEEEPQVFSEDLVPRFEPDTAYDDDGYRSDPDFGEE